MVSDKAAWHIPATELLFVQRKISGTAVSAASLEARVELPRARTGHPLADRQIRALLLFK